MRLKQIFGLTKFVFCFSSYQENFCYVVDIGHDCVRKYRYKWLDSSDSGNWYFPKADLSFFYFSWLFIHHVFMSNPPILEQSHVISRPPWWQFWFNPKHFVCFFTLNYLECQTVISSFAFSLNVVHTFNAKNKVLIKMHNIIIFIFLSCQHVLADPWHWPASQTVQCASAKIFGMMNQYISIGTNTLSGKLIRR